MATSTAFVALSVHWPWTLVSSQPRWNTCDPNSVAYSVISCARALLVFPAASAYICESAQKATPLALSGSSPLAWPVVAIQNFSLLATYSQSPAIFECLSKAFITTVSGPLPGRSISGKTRMPRSFANEIIDLISA
jgi:hypothetical protein